MPEEDHEERANYHMARAKAIWGELHPKDPDRMALESITWHFAAAAIHAKLFVGHALNDLRDVINEADWAPSIDVDTTRLERAIERIK